MPRPPRTTVKVSDVRTLSIRISHAAKVLEGVLYQLESEPLDTLPRVRHFAASEKGATALEKFCPDAIKSLNKWRKAGRPKIAVSDVSDSDSGATKTPKIKGGKAKQIAAKDGAAKGASKTKSAKT